MTISSSLSDDSGTVTIQVHGRFNHDVHDAFHKAFKIHPRGEKLFVVDLSDTHIIDSSALGMLLQLKNHNRSDSRVRLINARPAVRTALAQAGYASLFSLV